jgi:hypothetical protein
VEGVGETVAVPVLLRRIWKEYGLGESPIIHDPAHRIPRGQIVANSGEKLSRAIQLAATYFRQPQFASDFGLVLILVDADEDLPCVLGPRIYEAAQAIRCDLNVSSIVANKEYETWFVAAAASLTEFLDLTSSIPSDPEAERCGKAWIEKDFKDSCVGRRYAPPTDQARMTGRMDLKHCRTRSHSFDKLCRDLEKAAAQLPSQRG